jgi:D-glucuronyl C5-epimerase-like protein/putative peptidoglycan binding protein
VKPPAPLPTATPPNAPPGVQMLQAGDRAPAVADLQHALGALGLYSQAVDGVFGDSTGAAVLAFQRARGLLVDGVAGPTTIKALVDALSEGASTDAAAAEEGLATAAGAARLTARSADNYRAMVTDSLSRLERLPPGRVATLALVFHDVAAHAPDYNEPRALVLFSMLEANATHLSKHPPPTSRADIEDADGVAYRFFPSHGFQFHPIAAFARLNFLAAHRKRAEVKRLAAALVARGVPNGRALVWEYYFPFGGPSRWSSGFAQATAAQALARAAALLDDRTLFEKARAAFRAIPQSLSLELGGGLWVREYGYSDMPILNAQMQSLLSLYDYARITNDKAARAYTAKQATATRALLSSFDTGCWSRYSFNGSPASLDYHKYHVALLKKLAQETGESLWAATAERWEGYLKSGGPGAC